MSDQTAAVPSLDELVAKFENLLDDEEFTKHADACESYFRMVASGQISPLLRDQNAVMAAQCVSVIFEHAKRRKAGTDPMPWSIQYIKSEMIKEKSRENRDDRSRDWNACFNDACEYFIGLINNLYLEAK